VARLHSRPTAHRPDRPDKLSLQAGVRFVARRFLRGNDPDPVDGLKGSCVLDASPAAKPAWRALSPLPAQACSFFGQLQSRQTTGDDGVAGGVLGTIG
jgi:hypothetical protein